MLWEILILLLLGLLLSGLLSLVVARQGFTGLHEYDWCWTAEMATLFHDDCFG